MKEIDEIIALAILGSEWKLIGDVIMRSGDDEILLNW